MGLRNDSAKMSFTERTENRQARDKLIYLMDAGVISIIDRQDYDKQLNDLRLRDAVINIINKLHDERLTLRWDTLDVANTDGTSYSDSISSNSTYTIHWTMPEE